MRSNGPGRTGLSRFWPLYVMMIPGMLYLVINNYLPLFGLFVAFKDVNYAVGLWKSDWIGFKNFEYLFSTRDALIITRNTILFNAGFILVNLAAAVFMALMLNEIKAKLASRIYQSIVLIPMLISMVIVAYLAFAFLSVESGFMNRSVLPLLGKAEVLWYNEPGYWPFILVFVNAWKNVGFLCVIYYAAIIGIDEQLFEAATLDGASKLRQVWVITLPMLVPVITVMTLLAVGRIFYSDFGLFYQVPMDSGALYDVTNVIDTYVYRGLLQLGDLGMSSAAGLYQSVIGFLLVILSNLLVRRLSPENAMF